MRFIDTHLHTDAGLSEAAIDEVGRQNPDDFFKSPVE